MSRDDERSKAGLSFLKCKIQIITINRSVTHLFSLSSVWKELGVTHSVGFFFMSLWVFRFLVTHRIFDYGARGLAWECGPRSFKSELTGKNECWSHYSTRRDRDTRRAE